MQQSCHLYVSKKVIYLPSISIHSFSSTGVSFCAKTNLLRTATHEGMACRTHHKAKHRNLPCLAENLSQKV